MCGFQWKRRRWSVVFNEGGDLCLSDTGILLKTCEIEEQGDLSALVCR